MASKQTLSPKGKRRSLLSAFPDLQIGSSSATTSSGDSSGTKGSFSRGWPPMSESMRSKLAGSQSG